jgi:glycosyltransferase involved in cell wall biosynthesis
MKDQAGLTTPRRVLFVNHASRVSGAELSLLGLLARMDRARYAPLVACPDGPLARRLRRLGVEHVLAPVRPIRRTRDLASGLFTVLRIGSSAVRLAHVIRRRRIDIVHANSTTAYLHAVLPARLTGVPVVWHVRDLVELGRLGRILFRFADAVACVSEAVERRIAPYGDDLDKLWTITNGIDLAAFRASARPGSVRRELAIPADAPVVSQISQMTPWKGHEFLLGALPRVLAEVPGLRVLLAGQPMNARDAHYLRRLRRSVEEARLADTVTFTGWRDDVASVIADSDVVVMPSRAEPFGRSALEALALGKPVVGTRAGGLPEVVRHRQTGLLVDYGDTRALADALVLLLRSSEIRLHLGRNAADDAERFDISRTVLQVQNLYDDLLQK